VTLSAGVAVDEGSRRFDVDSLLQRSDLALYRAKHSGRNRVALFTSEWLGELPVGVTSAPAAAE
jgi:PleD family two-component response regulator